MNYKKITSLDMLFSEVARGQHDYFIQLSFGLRSSKYITEGDSEESLCVLNLIDDSEQELTREQIEEDEGFTNIGRAIQFGAFWEEVDEDVEAMHKDANGVEIEIGAKVRWLDEAGGAEEFVVVEYGRYDEGYFNIGYEGEENPERWAWHAELEVLK